MFGKKNSRDSGADDSNQLPAVIPKSSDSKRVVYRKADKVSVSGVQGFGHAIDPAAAHKAYVSFKNPSLETADYFQAKHQLIGLLIDRVDFRAMEKLSKEVRKARLSDLIQSFIHSDIRTPLTAAQLALLKEQVLDDMLGFGPLELLLADPDVTDIMVNGHKQVYIERQGKILLSDITFANEKHLLSVIQKIVALVGRRVDESSPMVDARMPDGSRFNAIIPPLALDGCLVSIRKFKRNKMPLAEYVEHDSCSPEMAKFLSICGNIRINMIVSGGTGSGKTTLLNALSGNIDMGERVITIEDAAELQLHQPHVLRLETRPANIEGLGEINQRQLVKNALRMRPDRIILGEIRGDEVIDLLSAMNTGHDGSMATIHANTPKDCLSRIENLVGMSGVSLSAASLRAQISSAVSLIVQVSRMRDGKRRIVAIDEILGLQGDQILMQSLFVYKPGPMDEDGVMHGTFQCMGITPKFITQAEYFGRAEEMLACLQKPS